MYECESWTIKKAEAPKNWCLWTVVLEKTLESPSDCEEIQPVRPKGDQSWTFITKIDAEAPILWPHDVKSWLTGKVPDTGKDWRQEEKGMTEDEMVGWHHWLNGHGVEQTLVDGDGQGNLECCSPWCHRVGQNWATELWLMKIEITHSRSQVKTTFTLMSNYTSLSFFIPDCKITPQLSRSMVFRDQNSETLWKTEEILWGLVAEENWRSLPQNS